MEETLKDRAWRVFNLSMQRVGLRCPAWARTSHFRRKFLKVYLKAARKNAYRFAYGKDGERYHVDHIIPLHGENVSGLHVPWNLHVIPATINLAKSNMVVAEYGLTHKEAPDTRPWGGLFSVSNTEAKGRAFCRRR